MDVGPHVSPTSLHASARIIRGASQIFTGGADGLHHNHGHSSASAAPPTESTPLSDSDQQQPQPSLSRQQSTTGMRAAPPGADQLQQRLLADVTDTVTRNRKWLVLIAIAFVVLMITMVVVMVLAVLAVVYNHAKPCDQPLKYYVLAAFLWSQVPSRISSVVTDDTWTLSGRLILTLLLAVPGWCLLGWGVYMVNSAVSCPKTNPDLFYPTQRFIYFQLGFAMFFFIATALMAIGARRVMLYVEHLSTKPGCADAVHQLPKVQAGDRDLIAEDGEIKGCPVCMDELSAGAVITPCNHYFHEDCLATWCASHLDCPLCRQQVGEPDIDKDAMTEP